MLLVVDSVLLPATRLAPKLGTATRPWRAGRGHSQHHTHTQCSPLALLTAALACGSSRGAGQAAATQSSVPLHANASTTPCACTHNTPLTRARGGQASNPGAHSVTGATDIRTARVRRHPGPTGMQPRAAVLPSCHELCILCTLTDPHAWCCCSQHMRVHHGSGCSSYTLGASAATC